MLGLIEGEGSFCVTSRSRLGLPFLLTFKLTLTESQTSLINAIKLYLDNLNLNMNGGIKVSDFSKLVSKRSSIFYEKLEGMQNLLYI